MADMTRSAAPRRCDSASALTYSFLSLMFEAFLTCPSLPYVYDRENDLGIRTPRYTPNVFVVFCDSSRQGTI